MSPSQSHQGVTSPTALPTTRKYPDEFYVQVMAMRRTASARAVGKFYGVPESTVHRWTREARRRGLRLQFGDQMCVMRAERLLQLMKARGLSWWAIGLMELVVAELEDGDAS